jgi:hypothetical protein
MSIGTSMLAVVSRQQKRSLIDGLLKKRFNDQSNVCPMASRHDAF